MSLIFLFKDNISLFKCFYNGRHLYFPDVKFVVWCVGVSETQFAIANINDLYYTQSPIEAFCTHEIS